MTTNIWFKMDAKFHPYFKGLLFNYRITYRNERFEIYRNHFIDKQDKEVCRSKIQYASIMGEKEKN